MITLTDNRRKILPFIALLFLVVPVTLFAIWFHAYDLGGTQAERVKIYNSFLPEFMRQPYMSARIKVVFSVPAIILSIYATKLQDKFWKKIAYYVLGLSLFTLLFTLYGLM